MLTNSFLRPPYYNCTQQTNDLGRQWLRYFRRLRGLPASSDVAALASVIFDLKLQTNTFLQKSGLGELEMAFMTAPALPGLYAEDLADAAEFAKLQMLTVPGSIFKGSISQGGAYLVSEDHTAFAGNGLGIDYLCGVDGKDCFSYNGHHIDYEKDEYEVRDSSKSVDEPPWGADLTVLFTKNALTVHTTVFQSVRTWRYLYGISNFSLGLSSESCQPPQSSADDSMYWHEVRQALHTVLSSWYNWRPIRRVVVYGESAQDETFSTILREEIEETQRRDENWPQPIFYSEDPEYVAARGAAVLANWCSRLNDQFSCFSDLRPRHRGLWGV
jgi:hypothetical protein